MTEHEFGWRKVKSIGLIMLSVVSLWLLLSWLIWTWLNIPRCGVCGSRIPDGTGVDYEDMVMCDQCWESQVRIWRECNPDHR